MWAPGSPGSTRSGRPPVLSSSTSCLTMPGLAVSRSRVANHRLPRGSSRNARREDVDVPPSPQRSRSDRSAARPTAASAPRTRRRGRVQDQPRHAIRITRRVHGAHVGRVALPNRYGSLEPGRLDHGSPCPLPAARGWAAGGRIRGAGAAPVEQHHAREGAEAGRRNEHTRAAPTSARRASPGPRCARVRPDRRRRPDRRCTDRRRAPIVLGFTAHPP